MYAYRDRRAENLRHLRVAVQAVETILATHERIEHRTVIELVRQRQPASVAGIRVEIGQHLVHAAEFGVEHLLQLRVGERCEHSFGPRGELHLDVERGPVPGVSICVAQTRRTSCAACTTATTGRSGRMPPSGWSLCSVLRTPAVRRRARSR